MKIIKLVRTCIACPSQWDAMLDDDRPVYIRYRWGYCSVRVGEKGATGWDAAVNGNEVLGFEWGGDWGGDMSNEQLIELLTDRGLVG